jgi:rhomboid protease GluP
MNDGAPADGGERVVPATTDATTNATTTWSPPAPRPPDEIALRRTPPVRRWWSALTFLLLGVVPAGGLPLAWFTFTGAIDVVTAQVLVGLATVVAVVWLGWLFWLPRPRPITIDDDDVVVPFHRRHLHLRLDEIVSIRVLGGAVQVIAAVPPGQSAQGDGGAWLLPVGCFVEGRVGAARFVGVVRARMSRLPHGADLHARLDANAARFDAFVGRRPWVTWGVVGACVVVFVGEWWTGAVTSAPLLVRMGANSGALVARGEVWRVVTACLLHGSVLHLAMNALSLLPTGALIERWLGRPGMAVVLFASGAGGHLASAWAGRAPLSVGASGAVFGLLGVLFVSSLRFRRRPVGGLRVPLSSWISLVLTNGLLSILPVVDVVAHAGGFVVGVVAGALVSPRPGQPPLLAPRVQRVLAAVVVVLTVVSVVAAVVRGWPAPTSMGASAGRSSGGVHSR